MRGKTTRKCALALVPLLWIFGSANLAVLAAGEVTVQVKDVTVSAGQTVTTELIMDGTFAAFQGALTYDTDALTLEKIEASSLLSGGLTRFNQDAITGEFISGSFVSASAGNMVVDGAALTFTFSAGSNASGTYSFGVEQLLVYDEEGTLLTVNAVDTVVVPVTPHAPTQEPTPPPPPQEATPVPPAREPTPAPTTNKPTPVPPPPESTPAPTATDPDPNPSAGSGEIIFLPIVAVIVVAGIVLTVVRIRKNKRKDTK
ncbi:MAG: hypothetical protein LBH86_09235 [Oscillospiraceae bacterium]|nr:hypothetical protein [Oscillospiraceae bacterium]